MKRALMSLTLLLALLSASTPATAAPRERVVHRRHRAVVPGCRISDHGIEAISGLVEWVAAELVAPASRAESYRPAVERMLSVLLERGRRPDGLWLSYVEPMAGAREDLIDGGVPNDNWGYISSAFAAYALTLPGDHPLRESFLAAVRQSLRAAATLHSARWQWSEPAGYAAALEGALYLLEFLDDPEAQLWVDREIGVMFAFQHSDGFVDRTYLDGNFVRTALLYGLSRTAGVLPVPWRPTLHLGAQRAPDGLYLHVESTVAWQGTLQFDFPRHRELMGLATSYPRLNAWPEWFVAEAGTRYEVTDLDSGLTRTAGGAELRAGWPLVFSASGAMRLRVRQLP